MNIKAPHFGYFQRKVNEQQINVITSISLTWEPHPNCGVLHLILRHSENEKGKFELGMTNSLRLEDSMMTGSLMKKIIFRKSRKKVIHFNITRKQEVREPQEWMSELPHTSEESQSRSFSVSFTKRTHIHFCNKNRHLVKWPDSFWIQSAPKFICLVGKLSVSCLNRLRSSSSSTCSVPALLTLGLSPLKRRPIQPLLISTP